MPVTPFHLGPSLLLGLLLFRYIDFPTFMVANVIIDVEPFLVLILNLDYPVHGFFHSFLGGTVIALCLAIIMNKMRESLSSLLSLFKLEQNSSFKNILPASVVGVYMHILLDSRMHKDIQPFFPIDFNPFLSRSTLVGLEVYTFCISCFIVGGIIFGIKLFTTWRKDKRHFV